MDRRIRALRIDRDRGRFLHQNAAWQGRGGAAAAATQPVFESNTKSENTTDAASLTIDMPATRPDGDLYLFLLMKDGTGDFGGIDGSWDSIFNETSLGNVRFGAWQKIGSSEPASYSVTHASEQSVCNVLRISGAHATTPINVSETDSGAASANVDAPDATTTVALTLGIRALCADNVDVTGTPSTEIVKGRTSSGGGGVGYGVSWEAGPDPAGATGTATFTNAADGFLSATIAIAPA